MSSREFAAWIAYDRIQPIGDRRLDMLFAMLYSFVGWSGSGKWIDPRRLDPFPDEDASGRAPSHAEDLARKKAEVIRVTRMLGGTVRLTGDRRDDRES